MKKITTTLSLLFCVAATYAQLNMTLAGEVPYTQNLNDAWGYVAPDGTEYALVCLQNGVSIVSLADPTNPVQSDYVQGVNSGWRDIKTYGDFAYVTNETSNGLMVIDLSNLPGTVTAYDWRPNIPGLGTLSDCHNIFIDETTGYAYLAGCNLNSGGLLFVDVFTTPGTPIYVGAGASEYSHDVYVRDNKAYSSEINIGVFSIYDVSDKSNPILLASQATPANTTHNTWLSDDGTVLFTTDETGNAPVGAYDISDLNDIKELDQYRPLETLGDGVIPHNVHVWQDWLIISYYTDGCIIVDASRPDNLIEVGNFDTFIPNSTGFEGVWGVYPFLPSGTIVASDIGNGLFILTPTYVRACYLEGLVTNADNGNVLEGATVTIVGGQLSFEDTGLDGVYKTGIATAGTYEVEVKKGGYEPFTTSVDLMNGEVTTLNVALTPLANFTVTGQVIDAATNEPIENALIEIANPDFSYDITTDGTGNFTIPTFFAGDYEAFAGKWGYKTTLVNQSFNENNNELTIVLEAGIEDVFSVDLGWTVGGSANQGQFERGTPVEVSVPGPSGSIVLQPDMDYSEDIGNHCYITGNSSNLEGGILIGGSASLTSPIFDASDMNTPILTYYTWFLNATLASQGLAPGNDNIVVSVSNGTTSVVVEEITTGSLLNGLSWIKHEINLADTIELTSTMSVTFNIPDDDFDDVSEALIDYFQVTDANPTSSTTSIVEDAFQLAAYPNPTHGEFILDYTIENGQSNAELAVYNVLGQKIETIQIQQATGKLELGANWTKGIYFVQIQQGNQLSSSLKVMKH